MTTSEKYKKVAISQCKSVEKLAEFVESVNGVDVDVAYRLRTVRCKMRSAREDLSDEITEEFVRVKVTTEDPR